MWISSTVVCLPLLQWCPGADAMLLARNAAAMWMLPESPRWLVVDGRLDEALAVIHVMFTNAKLPLGKHRRNLLLHMQQCHALQCQSSTVGH